MSLIDPSTPEGFFHMRLVPYQARLLEDGESFFPTGPEPGRETYFEDPLPATNPDRIESDTENITGRRMLEKLQAKWESQGETVLLELSEPLENLRQHIMADKSPEEEPEIPDFVYPLF